MKKNLAILSLGFCNTSIAEAIEAMPTVREFGYNGKAEAKKRKETFTRIGSKKEKAR